METRVLFSKSGKTRVPGLENDSDYKVYSSEEEDIFMEDPIIDQNSASKPLMYPRQRVKVKSRRPECKSRFFIRFCACFVLLFMCLAAVTGLIMFLLKRDNKYKVHKHKPTASDVNEHLIGCSHIEVEDVWVKGFPKLITESAFRMVEVNQDGVLDVIFGFGTGADGYFIPDFVCDIYFNGTKPCFGGLLALDGATGAELWRHYADHEMYAVNCNEDLNGDGINDCLGGGRAGAFSAISGKDGVMIWNFGEQEAKNSIMNLYTAQYIRDLDDDGVRDVLVIHGGDPLQDPGSIHRLSGRLLLMSGKTGKVIRWLGVPDNRESYYSPQIYSPEEGLDLVLFGTGGETHGGALWFITLDDLINGKIDKASQLCHDDFKGFMTPPVLSDLNDDGVEDIVISSFNSTVIAIDGKTHKYLWNATFVMSESYSTPAAGYFNNDSIPDFMVQYSYGPGYPIYYHSQTTILDGRDGSPLISPAMRDSVGSQASPIVISVEGYGNDIFLHWVADCLGHEGKGGEYTFVKDTNVHEQSRSDYCKLRFKKQGFSKMYAQNQYTPSPGTTVYYSENRKEVEKSLWVNSTLQAIEFVRTHPEHLKNYLLHTTSVKLTDDDTLNPQQSAKQVGSDEITPSTFMDHDYRRPNIGGKKGRHQVQPIDMYQDDDDDSQIYDNMQNVLNNILEKDGNNYYDNRNNYPYNDQNSYPRQREDINYYPRRYRSPGKKDFSFMRKKRNLRNKLRVKKSTDDGHATQNKANSKESTKETDPYNIPNMIHLLHNMKGEGSNRHRNTKLPKSRQKRHVGPHDEGGLQRLLSTGTLAPTTLSPNDPYYNHTIDLVFATYWFFPAKTQAILPEDQKCIAKKMDEEAERFKTESKYYGMDHDAYEHAITDECLLVSKHGLADDGTYETQDSYNPYNVHMGQMTVYRLRLKCTCPESDLLKEGKKRCSEVLPYDHQQWAAYMGSNGDSHWKPRRL